MTKDEYLSLAAARYDELKALNKIDNFYDYETEFINIWRQSDLSVLEKNLGTPSNDRHKKNLTTLS